jgi:hypothetical protein
MFAVHPFFSFSIIQLLKILFLEFLNKLKDHILEKYRITSEELYEDTIFFFQITTSVYAVNYLVENILKMLTYQNQN